MVHHKSESKKHKMAEEINENIIVGNENYCNINEYIGHTLFSLSTVTLALFILKK
jgi:ADP-ribosylglycohydrolase